MKKPFLYIFALSMLTEIIQQLTRLFDGSVRNPVSCLLRACQISGRFIVKSDPKAEKGTVFH